MAPDTFHFLVVDDDPVFRTVAEYVITSLGQHRVSTAGERICHWPIGHPREEGFHFCGKPAEAARPYCEEHCAVAYRRKSETAA